MYTYWHLQFQWLFLRVDYELPKVQIFMTKNFAALFYVNQLSSCVLKNAHKNLPNLVAWTDVILLWERSLHTTKAYLSE